MQRFSVKAILFTGVLFSLLSCMCPEKTSTQQAIDEFDGSRTTDTTNVRVAQLFALTSEISCKIQLPSLATTREGIEFEVRLWTNIGNFFEKVLVVRRSNQISDSSFFDIERSSDSLKFKRKILTAPRSGWDGFFSAIQNKNVGTPLRLRFDQPTRPIRDEGAILLEILEQGKYDFVYYGQLTSSVDGKKLLDLCEYFAYEFDVDMDCLGKHISP